MKQTIKIIFLIAVLIIQLGCSRDFLKPEPLSFFTPDVALVDQVGMESALAACESVLRYECYFHVSRLMLEYNFSDTHFTGGDDPNTTVDLSVILPDNTTAEQDIRIRATWEGWWDMIKYANVIISNIDVLQESIEAKNVILSMAYFYRAYAYYRLTHQFGDVPLVLEEITAPKLDFYTFTRESIMMKMKEDLDFAVQWLPAVNPHGRTNKAAANHLLTKINLALCLFDDAIKSSSDIINSGQYALMKTRFGSHANIQYLTEGFQAYANDGSVELDVIYDLHLSTNKTIEANKEVILAVIDRDDMEGQVGAQQDGITTMRNCTPLWTRAGIILTPSGVWGMINSADEFGMYRTLGRGQNYIRGNNWYNYDMWDDPEDLRHKQPNWWQMTDLIYNNSALKGTADEIYYGKHVVEQDLGTDSIRCWSPFPNKLIIPSDNQTDPQGGHADWYIYRLAETYLLRAEAYYWKDDLENAAKDLNEVHTRAGCSPIAPNNLNIGTILDERSKELFMEEHRKCELTRIAIIFAKTGKTAYNGKTYSMDNISENSFYYDRIMEKNNFYNEAIKSKNGQTYTYVPRLIFLPIPANAINANTLGHINQNKGYSGSESNIPPKVYPQDYY